MSHWQVCSGILPPKCEIVLELGLIVDYAGIIEIALVFVGRPIFADFRPLGR